jgi:tRNA G18 (ribose-2'-O)-methylase SpoU
LNYFSAILQLPAKYSKMSSSDETPSECGRMAAIKYNVHTALQDKPKEELQRIARKLALPVQLMLLNLDGNMNIAMSIRTAAVMGCSDVWVVGQRRYDARPEVGSKNYIDVHKVRSIGDDPAKFFEDIGVQPFLIEQGGTPIEDMNFKRYFGKPVCFIVGSESHGIPPEFAEKMSKAPRLTISQYGLVRSFNVSMASQTVLYEYFRQWRQYRKEF